MVAFGKPTIEECRPTSWSIPCAEQRRTGRPAFPPNDVRWSRTNSAAVSLVGPSAQRYSKSATATIPIVFQHGDNQIARQAAGRSYLGVAKPGATAQEFVLK